MDTTCEKGEILSISTAGSGAALDHTLNVATKATTATLQNNQLASGARPLGLVTFDVVNIDLTKYSLNAQKAEVQVGTKVNIVNDGRFVTNRLHPAATPVAGNIAYLAISGLLHSAGDGVSGAIPVGRWLSTKDGDGFADVEILLP
jgi:hypothetical protein